MIRTELALWLLLLGACSPGSLKAGQDELDAGDSLADSSISGDAQPGCNPTGTTYPNLAPSGEKTDRPAPDHADLNLQLRGYEVSTQPAELVDISGPTDGLAPKLNTLFSDQRVPNISRTYSVYDWDWNQNRRASTVIADPQVTLVGFETVAGETLHAVASGYDIGGGAEVRVLYVGPDSITFTYTRNDNIVVGYSMHVMGVCVDPVLAEQYAQLDQQGRDSMPAIPENAAFAYALGSEIQVAIRDTGAFMDPRSRKDWW